MGKNILITGGAGFIGSHVTEEILRGKIAIDTGEPSDVEEASDASAE